MPGEGFEPSRGLPRRILSAVRLPFRHSGAVSRGSVSQQRAGVRFPVRHVAVKHRRSWIRWASSIGDLNGDDTEPAAAPYGAGSARGDGGRPGATVPRRPRPDPDRSTPDRPLRRAVVGETGRPKSGWSRRWQRCSSCHRRTGADCPRGGSTSGSEPSGCRTRRRRFTGLSMASCRPTPSAPTAPTTAGSTATSSPGPTVSANGPAPENRPSTDDAGWIARGSCDVGESGEGRALRLAPASFAACAAQAVSTGSHAGGPLPAYFLALGAWLEALARLWRWSPASSILHPDEERRPASEQDPRA